MCAQKRNGLGRPGVRMRSLSVAPLVAFLVVALPDTAGASSAKHDRHSTAAPSSTVTSSTSTSSTTTTSRPPKGSRRHPPSSSTTTTAPTASSTTTTTVAAQGQTSLTDGSQNGGTNTGSDGTEPDTNTPSSANKSSRSAPKDSKTNDSWSTTTTTTAPVTDATSETTTPVVSTPPCQQAPTDSSTCLDSWIAWNEILHPKGFTWDATGETWEVDRGVRIGYPHDITIVGGLFHSGEKTPFRGPNGHIIDKEGSPVFRVVGGNGMSFVGTQVTGAHMHVWFDAPMAGASGFCFRGTLNISMTDTSSSDVYGDGITFVPLLNPNGAGDISQPTGTVDNFTSDNAGRIGLDITSAAGLVLKNITLTHSSLGGVVFESQAANMHARDVTIDGISTGGIYFDTGGAAEGPITIENWIMPRTTTVPALMVYDQGADPFGGEVLLRHDVLRCGWSLERSCVTVIGGDSVKVEHSTFYTANGREPHERLYAVTNHGHASFIDDVTVPNTRGGVSRPGTVSWNSSVVQRGGNFPAPRLMTSPPK